MKKIKSYTGIWNVEKVLYAINDFNLPFPVTRIAGDPLLEKAKAKARQ